MEVRQILTFPHSDGPPQVSSDLEFSADAGILYAPKCRVAYGRSICMNENEHRSGEKQEGLQKWHILQRKRGLRCICEQLSM